MVLKETLERVLGRCEWKKDFALAGGQRPEARGQ
jgi:hypothetical protein